MTVKPHTEPVDHYADVVERLFRDYAPGVSLCDITAIVNQAWHDLAGVLPPLTILNVTLSERSTTVRRTFVLTTIAVPVVIYACERPRCGRDDTG